MPIHLLTGRPRHGKTSKMMGMLLKAIKKGDRPIYAAGIDGLAPGLCEVLPDPSRWCSHVPFDPPQYDIDDKGQKTERLQRIINVPDGSLIFVDEAWKWFGHLHSAVGKPTPLHVLALAEHGHHGIDWVWTSQGPGQIYPFVRTLIEQHWHFVRRWGTQFVDIYKWDDLVDDVKSKGSRELAQQETTKIDSSGWQFYKSASMHTVKARLPWRLWLGVAAAVAAPFLLWYAYTTLKPDAVASMVTGQRPAGGLPTVGQTSHQGSAGTAPITSIEADRLEWLRPLAVRVPGVHGSQPIFDGREAQAVPRTFCVMSGGPNGDESCSCYTEQVTRILDVREDACRHVARHGQYDPFKAPPEVGAPGVSPGEPEPAGYSAVVPGTGTDSAQVGSQSQGEVWGRAPATLRASGG